MNTVTKKYNQLKRTFKNINKMFNYLEGEKKEKQTSLYSYKSPKVISGQVLSNLNSKKKNINSLSEVEFQVFSQFGDDGIIQWIIDNLEITNKTFVEFGVEKYIESNTRFLLFKDKWSGLVIDGDQKNIDYIINDEVSYIFNLEATCSFITKDNINVLIKSKGFEKDLGLLSIDIDGNDYWIWKSLVEINPIIVVSEYNAEFGLNPWTIPYKEDFVWDKKSNMYFWGTSLRSLCDLAEEKKYSFIGCNSQGNNAYFIRNDKMEHFKKLSCEEGFVESKFSLSRKTDGQHFSRNEKRDLLVGKEIYNTTTKKNEKIYNL